MKRPLHNSVIHLWDNSERNGPWLNWNGVLHWKNKAYHTEPQRNLTDISTEDSTGNGAFFIPISDRSDDLNVLMVEPGMAPYEKELNGLKEMQAAVGGLITAIYPFEEPVAIVANDEGILLEMEFNRSVEGGYGGIFGPFFVCGLTEDSFCSLTPEQMERYKKKFHHAEILLGARGNDLITMKVEPKRRNGPDQTPPRKQPSR